MAQDKRIAGGIKSEAALRSESAPKVTVVLDGPLLDHRGRGLDRVTEDEAEALAQGLEFAAKQLRRGWRGRPRVLH